jgi:hypothetical protein
VAGAPERILAGVPPGEDDDRAVLILRHEPVL